MIGVNWVRCYLNRHSWISLWTWEICGFFVADSSRHLEGVTTRKNTATGSLDEYQLESWLPFGTNKKICFLDKFLVNFYLYFGFFGFIIKLDENQWSDFLQDDVFNQSGYWLTSNPSMVDVQRYHRKTRSKRYQTNTGTIVHAWKYHITVRG